MLPRRYWHLVLIRHGQESDDAPKSAYVSHPIAPTSTAQGARTGFFKRLAAKLRGSWEATLSKGMKRFDQSQSECDLTKSAAYHQFKS